MNRCDKCSTKNIDCDKIVSAVIPIPNPKTAFFQFHRMTCREANHNSYEYRVLDDREVTLHKKAVKKISQKTATMFKQRLQATLKEVK